MRISSNLIFQTGLNQINHQQSDLLHLYKQAASGQRITSPADDPLAASQTVNLAQSLSFNQRLAENRAVLKQNLNAEENVLSALTLQLQEVKTRLVEAGNGTLSDADRRTLADVLRNSSDTLFGLANSTDGNGMYLFSGHAGSRPAFAYDANNQVTFMGDEGQRLIQADATRQIDSSDTGRRVFAQAQEGSTAYISQASPANAGTGVIAAPMVNDAQGSHVGNQFDITFVDVGGSVHYQISVTNSSGQIVATEGPLTHDGSDTLSLPGGLQAALSGQPVAGDHFILSPAFAEGASADINLFDTLADLVALLSSPTDDPAAAARLQNGLNTATQKIDLNYNQVLTVRSSVGSRLAEIDAIDASGGLQALGLRSELSRLEDVDYFEIMTQLQLRQTALEAAAVAFKRIQASSLLNIRS